MHCFEIAIMEEFIACLLVSAFSVTLNLFFNRAFMLKNTAKSRKCCENI